MFEFASLLEEHRRCVTDRSSPGRAAMGTLPLGRAAMQFVGKLFAQPERPAARAVRPKNKGRITLSGADFLRLAGEGWLNDELLNSGVALINHRDGLFRSEAAAYGDAPQAEPSRTVPRTRMLNSFFFSRLAPHPSRYNYSRVSKWGAKVGLDLQAVDMIIVPVNIGMRHWVLVAIDVRSRLFCFYDSITRADCAGVVDTIRRWLGDEVRSRLVGNAVAEWDIDSWAVRADPSWPRQTDGGSCGVFALVAADCFSVGAPLLFCQQDIPTLRARLAIAFFFDDMDVCEEVLLSLPCIDSPLPSDSEDEED